MNQFYMYIKLRGCSHGEKVQLVQHIPTYMYMPGKDSASERQGGLHYILSTPDSHNAHMTHLSSTGEISHLEKMSWTGIEEDRQMEEPEEEDEDDATVEVRCPEEEEQQEKETELKKDEERTKKKKKKTIDVDRATLSQIDYFQEIAESLKAFACMMIDIKVVKVEIKGMKEMLQELTGKMKIGREKVHVREDDIDDEQQKEREREKMDAGRGRVMVVNDTRDGEREERDEIEIETNLDVGEHEYCSDNGVSEESDGEDVGFDDIFGGSSSDYEDVDFGVEVEDAEQIDEDYGRLDEVRETVKGTLGKSGQSDKDEERMDQETMLGKTTTSERVGKVVKKTSPRERLGWEELSEKMICRLYERATSKGTFARSVLRKLVDDDILVNSNCYGKFRSNSRRTKVQAIDADILQYVLETTCDVYGVEEPDQKKCHRECVYCIDLYCRDLFLKKLFRNRSMKGTNEKEVREGKEAERTELLKNDIGPRDQGLNSRQNAFEGRREESILANIDTDKRDGEIVHVKKTLPRESLSEREISKLHEGARSREHFAKCVVRKFISDDILMNSNCSGKRRSDSGRPNVQAIDPLVLQYALETTYDVYGVEEHEEEDCRRECFLVIDTHCRNLFKNRKRSRAEQSDNKFRDLSLEYRLDRGILRRTESTIEDGGDRDETGLNPEKKEVPWKPLSDKEINYIRTSAKCKTKGNFAKIVLRKIVSDDVLVNSNCYGKHRSDSRRPNVQAIDPDILQYVLKTTCDVYGVEESDQKECHQECVTCIDTHCRGLLKLLLGSQAKKRSNTRGINKKEAGRTEVSEKGNDLKDGSKKRSKRDSMNEDEPGRSGFSGNDNVSKDDLDNRHGDGVERREEGAFENAEGDGQDGEEGRTEKGIQWKRLSEDEIVRLETSTNSRTYFAKAVLRKIVSDDKLVNSNCSGKRRPNSGRPNVQAIDPLVLQYALETTYDAYGVEEHEKEDCRRECIISIDTYCRNLLRKLTRDRSKNRSNRKEIPEKKAGRTELLGSNNAQNDGELDYDEGDDVDRSAGSYLANTDGGKGSGEGGSAEEGLPWKSLSEEDITEMKSDARSRASFAKTLLRKIVRDEVLVNSNCSGIALSNSQRPNVQRIDPEILSYVLKTTCVVYAVDESEKKKCHQECITCIDLHCKDLFNKVIRDRSRKGTNVAGVDESDPRDGGLESRREDAGKRSRKGTTVVGVDESDPRDLSEEDITEMKSDARSRASFAKTLLRKIVRDDVLVNSNCSGIAKSNSRRPNVQRIDPEILSYVLKTTCDVYAVEESEKKKCHQECITCIDLHCRDLFKKVIRDRSRKGTNVAGVDESDPRDGGLESRREDAGERSRKGKTVAGVDESDPRDGGLESRREDAGEQSRKGTTVAGVDESDPRDGGLESRREDAGEQSRKGTTVAGVDESDPRDGGLESRREDAGEQSRKGTTVAGVDESDPRDGGLESRREDAGEQSRKGTTVGGVDESDPRDGGLESRREDTGKRVTSASGNGDSKDSDKIVKVKISKVKADGLQVTLLPGNQSAFIPKTHLSDHPDICDALLASYSEGNVIDQALTWSYSIKTRTCIVTCKPLLLNAARNKTEIVRNFSELETDMVLLGVLRQSMSYGVFVEFPNHIVGLAPKAMMADEFVTDTSKLYEGGQTLRAKVTEVNTEKKRFLVSLKESDYCQDDAEAYTGLAGLEAYFRDRDRAELLLKEKKEYKHVISHKVGSLVHATVRSTPGKGIICSLPHGVDGVIPQDHIHGKTPKVGDNIEACVMNADLSSKAVTLSMKQDVIAGCKKSKPKGKKGKKAMESLDEDKGKVLLVKGDFVLAQTGLGKLVYLSPKQHLNDFSTLKDTIKVGSTVTIGKSSCVDGRILAALVKEDKPSKRKEKDRKSAAVHDSSRKLVGQVVDAVVKSVKETQVNVELEGGGGYGRIHATEVSDQMKPGSYPLESFTIGQKVKAKVIGYRHGKRGQHLTISHGHGALSLLELSVRKSVMEADSVHPAAQSSENEMNAFQTGQTLTCIINRFHKEILWVHISRSLEGKVHRLNLSKHSSTLENPESYFKPGQVHRAKVVRQDKEHSMLELSMSGCTATTFEAGSVVNCKVTKVQDNKAQVQLPYGLHGSVFVTDISDLYQDNPLEGFELHKYHRCCILEVSKGKQGAIVSLRPSRVKKASPPPGGDPEIQTLDDLKKGQVVRGYVRHCSDKGVFISLSPNIHGRILLKKLSAFYVKNPSVVFTVGKLLSTKVLSIDKETGKVELSSSSKDTGLEDPVPEDQRQSGVKRKSDGKAKKVQRSQEDGNDSGLGEADALSDTEAEIITVAKKSSNDTPRLQISSGFSWDDTTTTKPAATRKSMPADESDDDDDDDEEDDDDEAEEADQPPAKKSKKDLEEEAKVQEDMLYKTERALMDADRTPETPEDFDRLVASSPNSSLAWIRYMAFYLHSVDIEKARAIAERALKTINFREEQEKLNVWVAYLNLENLYGTEEEVVGVFQRALQQCEPIKVFQQLVSIYIRTAKLEHAEQLYETMVKRFKFDPDVWIGFGTFLMKNGRQEPARRLMQRSFKSLIQKDHVGVIVKFAQLEYRHAEPERGKTMFENILSNYPKRTDIWSIYLDLTIKLGETEASRHLFERVIHLKLSAKKVKFFFKRYLDFEKKYGDETTINSVKEKAVEYVESKTAIGGDL